MGWVGSIKIVGSFSVTPTARQVAAQMGKQGQRAFYCPWLSLDIHRVPIAGWRGAMHNCLCHGKGISIWPVCPGSCWTGPTDRGRGWAEVAGITPVYWLQKSHPVLCSPILGRCPTYCSNYWTLSLTSCHWCCSLNWGGGFLMAGLFTHWSQDLLEGSCHSDQRPCWPWVWQVVSANIPLLNSLSLPLKGEHVLYIFHLSMRFWHLSLVIYTY